MLFFVLTLTLIPTRTLIGLNIAELKLFFVYLRCFLSW